MAAYDESGDLWNHRIAGIASHRADALAGRASDRNPGPSEAWVVLGWVQSRRLRYPQQELLPL